MPDISFSFIFTADELAYLFETHNCSELMDVLRTFENKNNDSSRGNKTLRDKGLITPLHMLDPVLHFLFSSFIDIQSFTVGDGSIYIECEKLDIRIDKYEHGVSMYCLKPLKKVSIEGVFD